MVVASASTGAPILAQGELERYADAVTRGCLALRDGDTLFVQGQPGHRELMVGLAEAAYRAGARYVELQYLDARVQAARVRHAREEYLGPISPWGVKQLRAHLAPESAVVTIIGESDPGVFDGLPSQRVAEDSLRPFSKVPWYIRAIRLGRRRWTGVAWPTPFWAQEVYPELSRGEAQRRLALDLLDFCRLGPDDPPGHEGWTSHVEAIWRRGQALSRLELETLELRAPGTQLTVRLATGTRWLGGRDEVHGRLVCANFPTEENFTSPEARATEGTFRCTRPLSFKGRMIHGIEGAFRAGRLVRLDAATEEDREFLAAFIASDRNADRLGEVALVDASSRIGRAGRVYANTLVDENAVAHIAFGMGFSESRMPDGRSRSERGVNRASLHLDVMIGSDDFEATGFASGGRRIPLIRDGAWQV
jgi:aminopeptidase